MTITTTTTATIILPVNQYRQLGQGKREHETIITQIKSLQQECRNVQRDLFRGILILSRCLATGTLQATLKLICYLFLRRSFFEFQEFEQESGHRQFTGNAQRDFFWKIIILSRSLATGKLQATLKVIVYFCLGRFFFESSIAQFAISTLFSVPFGFNFVYIGSFDSTPWYFWGRHSTLENIENMPQAIILFKNHNVVLFICFAIARSAYLRLRPGSAYLRLRWLVENQHSAAFRP